MKKHFIYILVLLISIFYACQENDKLTYTSKASIYFQLTEDHGRDHLDSMSYSFATGTKTIDTFDMNVKIIGQVVDYDRYFNVEIIPELTTAVQGDHFQALENTYTISAGEIVGSVPVVMLNTDTILRDSTLRIAIRIVESDDFKVGVKEKAEAKLLFSDMLTKPSTWARLKYFFGDYNRTKHKVFIQEYGIDFPENVREIYSAYGLWKAYGALLSDYFKDNYPVYDEDNEIVEPW